MLWRLRTSQNLLRAEASFEPSAFSFRFLVFWALVIGGLIPIVDIVCYTWEQLRMVAFSSKMNLKTSWNWSFVLSIWLFERHFQENCLNRKNKYWNLLLEKYVTVDRALKLCVRTIEFPRVARKRMNPTYSKLYFYKINVIKGCRDRTKVNARVSLL